MKQENFLKPGLLRLILILVPLLALFSALTLISRHNPPPSKKDLLCPFMLIVLPPQKSTAKSVLKMKDLSPSSWLQNIHFFQSVLRDFNTRNYPSLELLFYLPLHLTKDNRWLVSTNSLPFQKQTLTRQHNLSPPRKRGSSHYMPDSHLRRSSAFRGKAEQVQGTLPQVHGKDLHPAPLIFKEIQKQLFPQTPLTLRDFLDRFPNRKWFLHLMTVPPRDSLKNLKRFSEKSSALYITSHNEKLLKQLLEEEMTVIYDFKSLLRFQLLGIFLLEKLFSFPGQGLIIPSTLPLSLKTAKKLQYSGQWLFVKKETQITSFPEQTLRQAKGLITREGRQALKWIQDKNPCLQEN